jgi:very-short-patch-repair endonuclease
VSTEQVRGKIHAMVFDIAENSILPWIDSSIELAEAESPIENLLLAAFLACQIDPYSSNPYVHYGIGPTLGLEQALKIAEHNKGHLRSELAPQIFTQVEINQYRVDFLAVTVHPWCGTVSLLAVECDGHDYHERTKEQAAADRSRDRNLMLIGIPTMRFTGSEIWESPLNCARQVLQYFAMKRMQISNHADRVLLAGGEKKEAGE